HRDGKLNADQGRVGDVGGAGGDRDAAALVLDGDADGIRASLAVEVAAGDVEAARIVGRDRPRAGVPVPPGNRGRELTGGAARVAVGEGGDRAGEEHTLGGGHGGPGGG